ncbi:hypothetical protein BDZ89DRAFT_1038477 [Hymenopellis radicata]|nr:hypothetical protein BDZ89DRAFT_1038477 [Hymenopellis radicata]
MPPSSTKATVARARALHNSPVYFFLYFGETIRMLAYRHVQQATVCPRGASWRVCSRRIEPAVRDTKAARVKSFSLPSTRRLRKHYPHHQMVVLWDRILTKLRNGEVPVITNHFWRALQSLALVIISLSGADRAV